MRGITEKKKIREPSLKKDLNNIKGNATFVR